MLKKIIVAVIAIPLGLAAVTAWSVIAIGYYLSRPKEGAPL